MKANLETYLVCDLGSFSSSRRLSKEQKRSGEDEKHGNDNSLEIGHDELNDP